MIMVQDRESLQPIIVCKDVSIAFNGHTPVSDVSLEIYPGEFFAFIGPNGAGKTTLIRAILGLIRPREGRISTPFSRKPPGYVPQQKSIDPLFPISVRNIVAMGLYHELGWWKMPDNRQKQRVDKILDRFGLTTHGGKTFSQLSGGLKQKVLLARALIGDPDILVLDEPASELDAASEAELIQHLHELQTMEGRTVLIAHHGIDTISVMADRVCRMNHGRAEIVTPDKKCMTDNASILAPGRPAP
jgi:manganese/zinc/iron transport system ATP- binding protein